MSQKITVHCPTCRYAFEVDLEAHEPVRIIYRDGDDVPQTVREYRFQCPQEGTYFIVPITVTED